MYKAANALSGLKRLLPQTRRHLDISGSYFRNWSRVAERVRALPLTPKIARAFVAYACGRGLPQFGAAVLVGFLGLLRVRELNSLRYSQLCFASWCVYIMFADSKGAQLKGSPERVRVKDAHVVSFLKSRSGRHAGGAAPNALRLPTHHNCGSSTCQRLGHRCSMASAGLFRDCERSSPAHQYCDSSAHTWPEHQHTQGLPSGHTANHMPHMSRTPGLEAERAGEAKHRRFRRGECAMRHAYTL